MIWVEVWFELQPKAEGLRQTAEGKLAIQTFPALDAPTIHGSYLAPLAFPAVAIAVEAIIDPVELIP